jgi:hypothetical protein
MQPFVAERVIPAIRQFRTLTARGHPMSEAQHFLQDARKSFRLAADSEDERGIQHHANMGRDYLGLAHQAAKLQGTDTPPTSPSLWLREAI